MSRIERLGGFWAGYVLLWGDRPSENNEVVFLPTTDYTLAHVQTLGIAGVGDIYQLKKDQTGLFILVKTERIPEDYEWTYTVGMPRIQYTMDGADGTSKPTLVAYPLTAISFKKVTRPDGIHSAPAGIVKRTKRPASPTDHESVSGSHSDTSD